MCLSKVHSTSMAEYNIKKLDKDTDGYITLYKAVKVNTSKKGKIYRPMYQNRLTKKYKINRKGIVKARGTWDTIGTSNGQYKAGFHCMSDKRACHFQFMWGDFFDKTLIAVKVKPKWITATGNECSDNLVVICKKMKWVGEVQ